METHSDVNEQVLIPGLEIARNATRSVNTSATLDEQILDVNTPVLQLIQKFIAKSIQKIKDFGNRLIGYIPPKPKVVDEALESFKNLLKNCTTREILQLRESKSALKKLCDTASNRWKRWVLS